MKENNIEYFIINDKNLSKEIAEMHLRTFKGFFLSSLGKGFLNIMYKNYIKKEGCNIIGAFENKKLVGFLAYSYTISDFYKYLLRHNFFQLGYYAFVSFIKNPKIFFRLIGAFTKSKKSKRVEKYIEISSLAVDLGYENKKIGSNLIKNLIENVKEFRNTFNYIKLETDKNNNQKANVFYLKNKFVLNNSYTTKQNREMNEYRMYI